MGAHQLLLPVYLLGACRFTFTHVPPADVNEGVERVAKYGARLAQLRQRRTAMEAALAAAEAESGLPSRQQAAAAAAEGFDDAASVADSLVSGLSIYTDHTHTGGWLLRVAGGRAGWVLLKVCAGSAVTGCRGPSPPPLSPLPRTGATSVASSSAVPSTVGGRRRNKKGNSSKVSQGGLGGCSACGGLQLRRGSGPSVEGQLAALLPTPHPLLAAALPRVQSKSKSSRIRQGSPQEEEQLALHLLGLAPAAHTCAEVGQLAEVLVVLGHAADAALLQQRLGLLVERQAAAAADVLAHPPPTLAFTLPRVQRDELVAALGPAGAAAAAGVLAGLPGAELQRRVEAAGVAVREARWKWDILRPA